MPLVPEAQPQPPKRPRIVKARGVFSGPNGWMEVTKFGFHPAELPLLTPSQNKPVSPELPGGLGLSKGTEPGRAW